MADFNLNLPIFEALLLAINQYFGIRSKRYPPCCLSRSVYDVIDYIVTAKIRDTIYHNLFNNDDDDDGWMD